MIIKGEGEDSLKQGVFSNDQLQLGYDKALSSDSQIKLLMPLLGETGCRLAEIVGLRIEDIDLENDLIHIRPNPARRLKTRNSERTLPLVGYARSAMEIALGQSDGEWLYPRMGGDMDWSSKRDGLNGFHYKITQGKIPLN